MSCSRHPFLHTMLSTTVLAMTMIVMTSAETINIKSLEPRDGFKIGDNMEIICTYSLDSLTTFFLKRNSSNAFEIHYNIPETKYTTKSYFGFECDLPTSPTSGDIKCWKKNLKCEDAAMYTCVTPTLSSTPGYLKAKSSIRDIRSVDTPVENQISTFSCDADVARGTDSTVTFVWTVKRGNNIDDEERINKRVTVPNRNTCLIQVTSTYEYNVTIRDSSNTTITCTIFAESRFLTFSIEGRTPVTQGPVLNTAGGLDGGAIAGIVLGVIAFIVLVVLLIWFFVIRKKGDKPDSREKKTGPAPNKKDYTEEENAVYAKSDVFKQSEPSEMLTDNHVYEINKAKHNRRHHPKKGSKFLPSHGDATDQMDELDEPYPLPPPPPPPSKPNHQQHAGLHDQLHYAELQHAVENSQSRRSKYIPPRTETPYAEVEIAKLTRD